MKKTIAVTMALTMTAAALAFFLFRTGNNSGTEDGSRQRGVRGYPGSRV